MRPESTAARPRAKPWTKMTEEQLMCRGRRGGQAAPEHERTGAHESSPQSHHFAAGFADDGAAGAEGTESFGSKTE